MSQPNKAAKIQVLDAGHSIGDSLMVPMANDKGQATYSCDASKDSESPYQHVSTRFNAFNSFQRFART